MDWLGEFGLLEIQNHLKKRIFNLRKKPNNFMKICFFQISKTAKIASNKLSAYLLLDFLSEKLTVLRARFVVKCVTVHFLVLTQQNTIGNPWFIYEVLSKLLLRRRQRRRWQRQRRRRLRPVQVLLIAKRAKTLIVIPSWWISK